MFIRKACENDLATIMEIYAIAREYMRNTGNPDQWKTNYPAKEDILSDIVEGACHVLVDGDEIVAVFYFKIGDDADYAKIYEGAWKNALPYAVIHRVAVKHQGRGLVKVCFEECYAMHPNLKIDTHRDNIPMQRALIKNGFKYCGKIYIKSGEERLAYQKI